MRVISLKKYGTILTGRSYGAQIYSDLEKEFGAEVVEFDFAGVVSLGSSFGEEVLVPFAKRQKGQLIVHSVSSVVQDCLQSIASDFNLKIQIR